jgi:hypothetical protein
VLQLIQAEDVAKRGEISTDAVTEDELRVSQQTDPVVDATGLRLLLRELAELSATSSLKLAMTTLRELLTSVLRRRRRN